MAESKTAVNLASEHQDKVNSTAESSVPVVDRCLEPVEAWVTQ